METTARNNKYDNDMRRRKHVSGRKDVGDDGTKNKVVNTKNCEQYSQCSDHPTHSQRIKDTLLNQIILIKIGLSTKH
jgi:hypothetical protein